MARLTGKKLPPHWVYVPSRREIRDLLRLTASDVRRVDFDGTGTGMSPVGLLLGYLERRVVDDEWCFFLRLWGVPESAVNERQGELARAAMQAIMQSIAGCIATPAAGVVKPSQLLLRFGVGTDGIVPKCRVVQVGRHSFSAGEWWT